MFCSSAFKDNVNFIALVAFALHFVRCVSSSSGWPEVGRHDPVARRASQEPQEATEPPDSWCHYQYDNPTARKFIHYHLYEKDNWKGICMATTFMGTFKTYMETWYGVKTWIGGQWYNEEKGRCDVAFQLHDPRDFITDLQTDEALRCAAPNNDVRIDYCVQVRP